jgi:hypothetical protein
MPRDREIKQWISPDAMFHRFADVFRAFFLICFAVVACVGFAGTAYFGYAVIAVEDPNAPEFVGDTTFSAPTVDDFGLFAERLLQGTVLWPQVNAPDVGLIDSEELVMNERERRAVHSGAALLESLVEARGVAKDPERRAETVRLIEYAHQRISLQPGAPNISFASLLFDHLMEASIEPRFFPSQASVAGQTRDRVERFLAEYPLLHVQWFADQVSNRAEVMAEGSDLRASKIADYQLEVALADQRMQRNAVLTLVCLVMFALSALLFVLIRIERNQTMQTQYMANRYVMYMPTPQADP